MKHLTYIFTVLLLQVAMIVSCEIHTSDNGDMDNFWMLTDVDTIATGHSTYYRENLTMWSFQGSLVVIRNKAPKYYYYVLNKKDNMLIMKDPRYSQRTAGDTLLWEKDIDVLRPFGINSLADTFIIKKLDSKEMLLEGKSLTLHFERY